jgi:hypothetical protein
LQGAAGHPCQREPDRQAGRHQQLSASGNGPNDAGPRRAEIDQVMQEADACDWLLGIDGADHL